MIVCNRSITNRSHPARERPQAFEDCRLSFRLAEKHAESSTMPPTARLSTSGKTEWRKSGSRRNSDLNRLPLAKEVLDSLRFCTTAWDWSKISVFSVCRSVIRNGRFFGRRMNQSFAASAFLLANSTAPRSTAWIDHSRHRTIPGTYQTSTDPWRALSRKTDSRLFC